MKIAYTVDEAAEEMKISPETVRALIKDGKLIARLCSEHRGIRIGRAAIDAFFLEPEPALITSTHCINPRVPKRALAEPTGAKPRRRTQ